jgi:hypothetical protein
VDLFVEVHGGLSLVQGWSDSDRLVGSDFSTVGSVRLGRTDGCPGRAEAGPSAMSL